MVHISAWWDILKVLRRRVMWDFLITFHHRNFKTLIKVSMLVLRRFNLMYPGLKMEHQCVLIKKLNRRIL